MRVYIRIFGAVLLHLVAGQTGGENDSTCGGNGKTIQCNDTKKCINSTVNIWVENIISCLNGRTDGCRDNVLMDNMTLCLQNAIAPTNHSVTGCRNCTSFDFFLVDKGQGACQANASNVKANITLTVCILRCKKESTTGSIHIDATNAPTTKVPGTTVAPSNTDAAIEEDNALGDYNASDSSDPNRNVSVLNFTGDSVGTEEHPAYKSEDGTVEVSSIVLEKGFNGTAKAVIVDVKRTSEDGKEEVLVAPVEPEGMNDSWDRTSEIKGTLGSKILMAAVFDADNGNRLKVHQISFKLDASSSTGLAIYNEKAATDRAGMKFVQSARVGCGFINVTTKKMSEEGCHTVVNGTTLECECNHTTVFAVLLSVKTVEVPPGVKIASYITEVTSVIFLILTASLLTKVRKHVRGDRVKVQICVTLSLLILHVLNIFHDAASQNEITCEMFAVLIHFFLLSSAMWMLMEGVTLVCKTMDTAMRYLSGRNAKRFAIFRYVASWTIPFIIVLISASYGLSRGIYLPVSDLYTVNEERKISGIAKYHHCWVGPDEGMLLGSVIIPIASILCLCTLIVARMCYVVFKMSSESENYKPTSQRRQSNAIEEMMELEHVQAALKATLVLLPVLGVPWFLGFFSALENGTASVVFMYLNAIINGLQGVFLFFVYCVIGKEVRMAIAKSYARKRYIFSSNFSSSIRKRASVSESNTLPHSTMFTNVTDDDKNDVKVVGNNSNTTSGL